MAQNNKRKNSRTLIEKLKLRIANEGPISVSKYMQAATKAYYEQKYIFGKRGDFITAPEISQVFGELIGLWAITTWIKLGRPKSFNLVECGPGKGTLLSDALRAIVELCPEFMKAASIILVENSSALRLVQKKALSEYDLHWQTNLEFTATKPVIIIANEFIDALPINQYQKLGDTWFERLVDYKSNKFLYKLSAEAVSKLDPLFINAKEGSILETSESIEKIIQQISILCVTQPGVALIIDYGYVQKALGDTLQAIRNHKYHPVLESPGSADITAHVDFSLITRVANTAGANVYGPVEQGVWLKRLGLKTREAQLCYNKDTASISIIKNSIDKLVNPSKMGSLFKAMAITTPNLSSLEGFSVKVRK